YGVLVGVGSLYPENPYLEPRLSDQEVDYAVPGPEGPPAEVERAPRPLSPTKLLPFISNPYRQSDGDLEALRKRLSNAPRALKKRSSITEPEGPAGPNIQKLLYQKTTLAAMETLVAPPLGEGGGGAVPPGPFSQPERGEPRPEEEEPTPAPHFPRAPAPVPPAEQSRPRPLPEDFITPPPPPAHPAPRPDETLFPPPPPGPLEEEPAGPLPPLPPEGFLEEFPPYPPPPYPSGAEQEGLADDSFSMKAPEVTGQVTLPPGKRTNLRKLGSERIDHSMRVKFNPLALLLDSSLEGEFDLVQRIIYEVDDPSLPNDEGITALHNAVCAGHTDIVKFLVQFGVNVNAADSDGWTPLHCAASCNNVQVCKFLVESGAAVFATTYSDLQTAADKCEELEEGYAQCSQFLYVYGKPVLVGVGSLYPENPYLEPRLSDQEVDYAVPGPEGPPAEVERAPRPLSPTKLLPFISNPYRQSDGDLEALRKRLSNAPRALKKRSSITEPEGPAGPNIQKLLYQKTTLAAMETLVAPPLGEGGGGAYRLGRI
ncbi:hypothetical protein CRUP_016798, partial [Coryphaenoides rupestris]